MAGQDFLIKRIAAKLKLRQAGQDVSPEDAAAITEVLPGAFAELARRNVILAYQDEVDDELVEWLAVWIAQHAADDFGLDMDGGKMEAAEMALRAMAVPDTWSCRRATPDYF